MSAPEHRLRAELGQPAERTLSKVRDQLLPWVQEYIRRAPFAVLATSDRAGHCDASPRGGTPGFVQVLDNRHLLLPDVAGNRLFQSYSNVLDNPQVGLLFLIPGVDETVRVNSRAERLDEDGLRARTVELAVHEPDANARLQQGLWIEVREAYGHCPRALTFSRLWDPERIVAHRSERPLPPKPRGV
jgi:PPOX class probable FMN-dependent enzyme